MKRKILDFSIMKEEISQNNVPEMAELIAFMELRFQIGYLGSRAQKMYADLYGDIKHKSELGYRITKKDLLAFIEELLKGDVNDKEYQKQIINHLVSQVFVSDDDTVVFFNLRGGKDIEKLTIDDMKEAVNSAKGVRMQTSPLHHQSSTKKLQNTKSTRFSGLVLFCYRYIEVLLPKGIFEFPGCILPGF